MTSTIDRRTSLDPIDVAAPTPMLFPVSARSPESLSRNAARLAEWLDGPGATVGLDDVGYTLGRRRAHLSQRLTVVAADRSDLVARLRAAAGGVLAEGVVFGSATASVERGAVFVFSGHGSQWAGMGSELLATEPAFAAVVDELEEVFLTECGRSLRDLITDVDLAAAGMALVQPALFATQVGLTRVWQHYGVEPAAVVGHSMGEVAAAVVAGGLTLADGARVICRRSALIEERLTGGGAVALVELPAVKARRRIREEGVLDLAVHSSTRASVVTGRPEDVERFIADCEADGITAHWVPGVRFAAHSRQVDAVTDELVRRLDGITARTPVVPVYGTALTDVRQQPVFDGRYWADNLRNPVRFAQALQTAAEDGYRCFIEVSPHPVVGTSINDTLKDSGVNDSVVLGSLKRDQPAREVLATNLAFAHCRGVRLDWRVLHGLGKLADLPTMAWNHVQFTPKRPEPARAGDDRHPLLGPHVKLPGTPARHVWQVTLDSADLPWLSDHQIHGTAVLPGTAYVEAAVAAAGEALSVRPDELVLSDVEFHRMAPVSGPLTLTTTFEAATGRVEICSDGPEGPVVHATATADRAERGSSAGPVDVAALKASHPDHLPVGSAYQRLVAAGQQHGPAFAAMTEVATGEPGACSELSWPQDLPGDARLWFHPAFLDACLHGLAVLLADDSGQTVLPVGLGSVRLWRRPAERLVCHATVHHEGATPTGHVEVYDLNGNLTATVADVRLRHLGQDDVPVPLENLLHTIRWVDSDPVRTTQDPGSWSVHGPGALDATAKLERVGVRHTVAEGTSPARSAGGVHSDGVLFVTTSHSDGELDPRHAQDNVLALADLVRGVLDTEGGSRRLVVVTRGTDPVQTAVVGLARTLRHEHPELRTTVVDAGSDLELESLAAELAVIPIEDEVRLRGGKREVARLARQPLSELPDPTRPPVRSDGAYVVSGGTRGLGLITARWLSGLGAGTVVVCGRAEPGPEASAVLADMAAAGTAVEVVLGDITESADQAVAAAERHGHVLRGVVHAAGVVEDALLEAVDADLVARVWLPKATGAQRLHAAVGDRPLDWWLSYSSFASMVGAPGQAAYATANAYLDAFGEVLRERGVPATTVNWTRWEETGAAVGRELPGLTGLSTKSGLAVLATIVSRDVPQVGVALIDAAGFTAAHPHIARSAFFSELGIHDVAEAPPPSLHGRTDGEKRQVVTEQVAVRVAAVLGYDVGRIPRDRPLVHVGLDSLTAVKIKNAVCADFSVDLPVARLLGGQSIDELAQDVLAAIGTQDGAGAAPSATDDAAKRAQSRTTRMAQRRAARRRS